MIGTTLTPQPHVLSDIEFTTTPQEPHGYNKIIQALFDLGFFTTSRNIELPLEEVHRDLRHRTPIDRAPARGGVRKSDA